MYVTRPGYVAESNDTRRIRIIGKDFRLKVQNHSILGCNIRYIEGYCQRPRPAIFTKKKHRHF